MGALPASGPVPAPGRQPPAAEDVDEAVYDVVEAIPPGRVSTYGAIGRLVGVYVVLFGALELLCWSTR